MKLKSFFAICTLAIALCAHAEDPKDGVSSEAELGFVKTTGNTSVSALNTKDQTKLKNGENVYSFNGGYLYSKSNGVNSAKSWNLGLKYERVLNDSFSIFLAQKVEGDKFQFIKQRYSTDLGGKYYFKKEEKMNWFAELGYRYTRENQVTLSRTLHYARAYTESEKKWNESVSSKVAIEYLPNFTVWSDYQLNTEVSLSSVLTSVFSVKFGYLTKYDHLPAVGITKKTDSTFTTNLVAKF